MNFWHNFGHAAIHQISRNPQGTVVVVTAALSNPIVWGVAAGAGAAYLIYKVCND